VVVEQNLALASNNHENSGSCPWLPPGQPSCILS